MRAANIMRPSGLHTDMKKRGLWQKYSVRKNKRYKPHDGEYFTLAPRRDIHAKVALRTYAQSCATSCPELAKDIIRWLDSLADPTSHAERRKETMTIEEVKQIRQRAELCAEVTVPGEHLRALCDLLLETEAKLREVEEERDQAREALRSVRSLCRDKSFPGTMDMRLDEIEQHVCKALGEG